MTAPTVDLSLPTPEQLLGAASPNPETVAAQVSGGDPGRVADIGARLQRAGGGLDQVHAQSSRTQQVLAGGFTNDGSPVYDAQTHRQAMPAGFPDAGTRLHDAGRRVSALAEELRSTITEVDGAQAGMWTAVDNSRRGFAAEVDAARGPGGLIPPERVGALLSRRGVVAGQMQQLVDTCGRQVADRVGRYEQVLRGCQRLLQELGLPAAAAGPTSPATSGTRLSSVLDPRFEGNLPTPGTPRGPEVLVTPVHPAPPPHTGFPVPLGGADVLVNVPAPDLGTGVQDGPGSEQPVPSIRVNADSGAGGEATPDAEGTATDPVQGDIKPVGKLSRPSDSFLKNQGIDPHEVKGENGLILPSRFDIYLDREGNMFGVKKGDDPRSGEYLGNVADG